MPSKRSGSAYRQAAEAREISRSGSDRKTVARYSFAWIFARGKREPPPDGIDGMLRCGKYLNTGKSTFDIAPQHQVRLADARRILYLWRPAVRPAKFHTAVRRRKPQDPGNGALVMTWTPWEKAMRPEWQPAWAFPAHEAPRQVGPIEFQVPDAYGGQRAFSWLLFS